MRKIAKYTVELREICESYVTPRTLDVEKIIDVARPKIFSFNYPIFDESYRTVLEKKILLHNYTREIAHETYGLWKLKLNTKLNEIMPYYNQLYESELLEFNPFYDTELNRTYDRKNEETGNTTDKTITNSEVTDTGTGTDITDVSGNESLISNNENTYSGLDKFSDTPQGTIANLESGEYLSNARKLNNSDVGKTDTTSTNKSDTNFTTNRENINVGSMDRDNVGTKDVTNLEEFLESVKGKQGGKSYSELLKEYRKTFINIDLMVIDELGELFFTLW